MTKPMLLGFLGIGFFSAGLWSCLVGGDNNCNPNFAKICVGGFVYWTDSCGNTGDVAETCSCGCKDNISCKTNCGNCTPHHHSVCTNSFESWYNSCNVKENDKACDCGCAPDGKVCQSCPGEDGGVGEEPSVQQDAGEAGSEQSGCNPPCTETQYCMDSQCCTKDFQHCSTVGAGTECCSGECCLCTRCDPDEIVCRDTDDTSCYLTCKLYCT